MTGTLNNNTSARDIGYGVIQFLRKRIQYTAGTTTQTIGTIPAGSLIIRPASGVAVLTVTNAGTNNQMNVGTTATSNLYGTNLATTTLGFVPLDENVSGYVASDTTITATFDLTGTAATTGDVEVIIAFVTGGR